MGEKINQSEELRKHIKKVVVQSNTGFFLRPKGLTKGDQRSQITAEKIYVC